MSDGSVTILLDDIRKGVPGAQDRLLNQIYPEIKRIAVARMAHERAGHTLQPTALVNEAYIKVLAKEQVSFEDRRQLYGAFAKSMKDILIESALRRKAKKRGGDRGREPLGEPVDVSVDIPGVSNDEDLIALHEALPRLAESDGRAYEVVMLHYFAGLRDADIAEMLGGVATKTVQRERQFAHAWLLREMKGAESPEGSASA